jgi:hypothetical protein
MSDYRGSMSFSVCPVDGCGWAYEHPEPDPDLGGAASLMDALRDRNEAIERKIADHAKQHTPPEYLRTIARLNAELGQHRPCIAAGCDCPGPERLP